MSIAALWNGMAGWDQANLTWDGLVIGGSSQGVKVWRSGRRDMRGRK